MVQETSATNNGTICMLDVKNENIEYMLSDSVRKGKLRIASLKDSAQLDKLEPDSRIIAFIIGSDVKDPIQSAQRLHAYDENAAIVILSDPGTVDSLRQAVKFSPFIGTAVFCLDESKEAQLEYELEEILEKSQQSERYRNFIARSGAQFSADFLSPKSTVSQKFINKLMDTTPIGIAIVEKEGKLLGWNKEATKIFGRSESEILGTPLSRLFSRSESEKLKAFLKNNFPKPRTGLQESLSLERNPQNKRQYLSLTAAPFTYSESEQALILAIKDVTERIRAQKELEEMNETLEQRVEKRTRSLLSYQKKLRSLASKLSKAEENVRQQLATEIHDNLGQMLAVNKMKLDSLQTYEMPVTLADRIEEIKEGVDDALNYTRDLMSDLKPPPSFDKEDVTEVLEWLAQKMNKHGLNVTIEDDGQPKHAREEIRTVLLQCVRELLFNVIRHSEVKEAHLELSRTDEHISVIVEDKGKGFNPEKDTFDPAQQTGFGLFNIRERMDLMGGSVDIDSEPGRGTKVQLIAPLKYGDKEKFTQYIAQDIKPEKSAKKIRVMLVDDHEMVRSGLKNIVNAEPDLKVVAEAADGREAIELVQKTAPDVIVMDVNLPNMDGIETTKKITSMKTDVRIIGLSLHDQQEIAKNIRNAGATAYLSKNEAFKTLCATIRTEAKAKK